MNKERQEIRINRKLNKSIKFNALQKDMNISETYDYYLILGIIYERKLLSEDIIKKDINNLIENWRNIKNV